MEKMYSPSTLDGEQDSNSPFRLFWHQLTRQINSRRKTLIIAFLALTPLFYLTFALLPADTGIKDVLRPNAKPVWLVATMSAYWNLQRRAIIRSTWQRLYKNKENREFKFVVGKPNRLWEKIVALENEQYGDMIILEDILEVPSIANTVKTVEFFQSLTKGEQRWSYVSKIDDDSFLDAHKFWSTYLAPHVKNSTDVLAPGIPKPDTPTVFGKRLYIEQYGPYPSGQFYTLTWDMLEVMVAEQVKRNVTGLDEDVLVRELLKSSGAAYTFQGLHWEEAFEISFGGTVKVDDEVTAWADEKTNLGAWYHPIGPDSINAHRMKKDDDYLQVALCYGPSGPERPASREEREKKAN